MHQSITNVMHCSEGDRPGPNGSVVVRKGRLLSPQARAFVALIKPDLLAPREYDESGHSER